MTKQRFTVHIAANGTEEGRVVEAESFTNDEDNMVRFYKNGTKLVFAIPASNVTGIEPRD